MKENQSEVNLLKMLGRSFANEAALGSLMQAIAKANLEIKADLLSSLDAQQDRASRTLGEEALAAFSARLQEIAAALK